MLGVKRGVINRARTAYQNRETMVCKMAYVRGSGYAEGVLRHPTGKPAKKK